MLALLSALLSESVLILNTSTWILPNLTDYQSRQAVRPTAFSR